MNKYGNYTQNNHCTCGKLINNVSKYCTICHLKIVNKRKHSKNCQCCACKAHRGEYKGKNHPLFGSPNNGKKNGRYIDGRTLKKYYCDCGRELKGTSAYLHKECIFCSRKRTVSLLWQNTKFKNKQLKASMLGRLIIPNKPERLIANLLNLLFPKQYKFVGNGLVIIKGFNPDFINKKQKKIIEFFGCYWHKYDDCGFGTKNIQPKDVGRLDSYYKSGYKTLIIWEHELKDIDKLIKKLLKFVGGV